MSAPKHTPGPWTWDEFYAELGNATKTVLYTDEYESPSYADAALIAAAPELLEAAEGTVKRLERLIASLRPELLAGVRPLIDMALRDTRAAIAKAKGETP